MAGYDGWNFLQNQPMQGANNFSLPPQPQPQGSAYGFGAPQPQQDFLGLNGLLDKDRSGLNANANATPSTGTDWMSPGGFAAGAGAAANIGSMFLGFQNSRLAKDQLAFQKEAFLKQFEQQVQDRERRVAGAKAAAEGVSRY